MHFDISCNDAKRIIDQGGQLVDVRTPEEHARFALPGSINIPVQLIMASSRERLDPDRPVVVYCHSGTRSAAAENVLGIMGFKEVHNLGPAARYYQC